MSMKVDLGDECEAVISQLVSKGSFPSSDAALRKGVELVIAREAALDRLRADAEAAERDRVGGLLVDADDAFDEMDARISAAFKEKAAAA